MLKSENLIHICGAVSVVLLSVSLISYTGKFIFGYENVKTTSSSNCIYDLDYGVNFTQICLFAKDFYRIPYENSPCYNKTLIHWYIPWVANYLWREVERNVRAKKKLEEVQVTESTVITEPKIELENKTAAETKNLEPEMEKPQEERPNQKPSEIVYTILAGLLLLSALAACWEVFKDKLKKDDGSGGKSQDRECSLAEFTINRHLRRESQQQGGSHLQRQASFEIPAKVTQNLIRQSSLDRAFSKSISEVNPDETRRNSVPTFLMSDKITGRNSGSTSTNSPFRTFKRQQSLDMSTEEVNLDGRKKPRHFIRRH